MTGAPEIAAAINAAEPVEFDQPPIELKEAGLSQRDALLQVSDKAEIWRSPDGETHASVPVGDHFEYHRLNSRSFRDWMLGEVARSYLNNGRPASVGETSMRDARLALEAQAYLNGVQQEAPLRTAAHGDAIYIDRGTSDWSVFGITSAGWKVEPRSPVPILRSKRAAAFAEPIAPGSFTPLRHLLGHLDDGQFVLFVSWCLWALPPTGPYPILIVTGEAGSGKALWSGSLSGSSTPLLVTCFSRPIMTAISSRQRDTAERYPSTTYRAFDLSWQTVCAGWQPEVRSAAGRFTPITTPPPSPPADRSSSTAFLI